MLTRKEIQAKLKLMRLPAIAEKVPMSLPTLRKIQNTDEPVNNTTLQRLSAYLEGKW